MLEGEECFIKLVFPLMPLVARVEKTVDPSQTLNSDNVND
jgi:hypothetical protein